MDLHAVDQVRLQRGLQASANVRIIVSQTGETFAAVHVQKGAPRSIVKMRAARADVFPIEAKDRSTSTSAGSRYLSANVCVSRVRAALSRSTLSASSSEMGVSVAIMGGTIHAGTFREQAIGSLQMVAP